MLPKKLFSLSVFDRIELIFLGVKRRQVNKKSSAIFQAITIDEDASFVNEF